MTSKEHSEARQRVDRLVRVAKQLRHSKTDGSGKQTVLLFESEQQMTNLIFNCVSEACSGAVKGSSLSKLIYSQRMAITNTIARALLTAMNNPASLAPNPDNQVPLVRKTDEGDAQTASMNKHAAPVDARDGGEKCI